MIATDRRMMDVVGNSLFQMIENAVQQRARAARQTIRPWVELRVLGSIDGLIVDELL